MRTKSIEGKFESFIKQGTYEKDGQQHSYCTFRVITKDRQIVQLTAFRETSDKIQNGAIGNYESCTFEVTAGKDGKSDICQSFVPWKGSRPQCLTITADEHELWLKRNEEAGLVRVAIETSAGKIFAWRRKDRDCIFYDGRWIDKVEFCMDMHGPSYVSEKLKKIKHTTTEIDACFNDMINEVTKPTESYDYPDAV